MLGRLTARRIGLARLRDQFGLDFPGDPHGAALDRVRASQLGARHAVAAADLAARAEGSARSRWKVALDGLLRRTELTATTETASAATLERRSAATHGARLFQLGLVEIWNAEFDACPTCRALNGTVIQVGGPLPGLAHAGCRCWLSIRSTRRRGGAATT